MEDETFSTGELAARQGYNGRHGLGGEPSAEPDVRLDVPQVNVEELILEVEDLRAHVSIQAEVLNLVRLSVGAEVQLGGVHLDMKGVEAQALLKVRLDRFAEIFNRVLSTIDRNPEILDQIVAPPVAAGPDYHMARQRRTTQLREQYGPEYDRAVDLADSQHEAESELLGRSKRHEQLELRSLDSSERENFERCWSDIQGQFVDDPSTAVRNADLLVAEVMSARGYPVEDLDQRANDLSVRYPEGTQRYREARRIAQADEDGTVDTEDLRQAVTAYRSLVLALLADDEDRTRHNRTEHDNNQMTERETQA